jgi:hypothetical protein
LITIAPLGEWTYEGRTISYAESWKLGLAPVVVLIGIIVTLLGVGFYRGKSWVRVAVVLGFLFMTGYAALDAKESNEWAGSLFWACLSFWYLFRKRDVVAYFAAPRCVG